MRTCTGKVLKDVSVMLKLKIETEKPKYCIAKDDRIYFVKHIVRSKRGIRALIDVKSRLEKTLIFVDEHPCPLAVKILDSGCIITSAEVSESKVVWNLVCSEEAFLKLMSSLKCRLLDKRHLSEKENITYKEYTALKKALEMGFFDSPKRITLEKLAKESGVAKSTLSDCLRRGLKKVLKDYFEGT